jgi:hypothetical protein
MKNCEVSEKDDKYMSWDEFKEEYLPKVEYLAKIVGIPRDYGFYKHEIPIYEEDIEECSMDEDNDFVDFVIRCILDWEGKYVTPPLLYHLRETDGAEEIFDEVYRVWAYRFCRGDELLFRRKPIDCGTRSDSGKGDIVDIFLLRKSSDSTTLLSHGFGEDFADCGWPVAVKVKHKSYMSNEELTKGLRDLADALEARFENCYPPSSDGYIVPNCKQEQAILCGLYRKRFDAHAAVIANPGYPLHKTIKDAGWLDPNVTLDSGIGQMLKRGWPELYKRVRKKELSPFEALLETGWVDTINLYDALTSNGKTQEDVEDQVERVDDSGEDLLKELEDVSTCTCRSYS